MNDARTRFSDAIANVRRLSNVHAHLDATYQNQFDVDDISRAKVVWVISAFDKLLHDLIRIGMVQTFIGARLATPKYLGESIPLSALTSTYQQPLIPAAAIFEQVVFGKLKYLSFQDPRKLVDGLSLIWSEAHKFNVLAQDMSRNTDDVRTTLALISSRRNAIVHESDLDPVTHKKTPLLLTEAESVVSFVESLGLAICGRVIQR